MACHPSCFQTIGEPSQDDKEPIGGDQDAAGEGLGRLAAALGSQRGQREPEALLWEGQCRMDDANQTTG